MHRTIRFLSSPCLEGGTEECWTECVRRIVGKVNYWPVCFESNIALVCMLASMRMGIAMSGELRSIWVIDRMVSIQHAANT